MITDRNAGCIRTRLALAVIAMLMGIVGCWLMWTANPRLAAGAFLMLWSYSINERVREARREAGH